MNYSSIIERFNRNMRGKFRYVDYEDLIVDNIVYDDKELHGFFCCGYEDIEPGMIVEVNRDSDKWRFVRLVDVIYRDNKTYGYFYNRLMDNCDYILEIVPYA